MTLISNMAQNSQQFNTRSDLITGRVNEVDTIQHQLVALTSKLDKLMTKGPSAGVVCGI